MAVLEGEARVQAYLEHRERIHTDPTGSCDGCGGFTAGFRAGVAYHKSVVQEAFTEMREQLSNVLQAEI